MVPIGLRISSLNKHHHPAAQGAICVTFFTASVGPNTEAPAEIALRGVHQRKHVEE